MPSPMELVLKNSFDAREWIQANPGVFAEIDENNVMMSTHVLALLEGAKPVAMALLKIDRDSVHLEFLEVAKGSRRHQFGAVLLNGIFDHAATLAHEGGNKPYVTLDGFTSKGQAYLYPHLQGIIHAHPGVEFAYIPRC